ncbi:hypothetical protein GCQ56_07925 [Marinifilum sp. N1E240]|uniref:hypothetical protein n=1 Tax=Marinifilum sp. N1E240 TaxID=2608082 RepID=UPI00128C1231|nr:hypothetical protein [Marinifilum sp. N1E240]MPQ46942.1 hypothetical protein [Marinifilum sp. N1E240]
MNLNKSEGEKVKLDQLLVKLKKEDNNYSNLCKRLKLMYWILIPIYTLMAIVTYLETMEMNNLISGFSFVGAFLIFALVMGSYQKEYKSVDYALPTLLMLKKAAARYHPFRPKTLWALLAILLMYAGISSRSDIDSHSFFHPLVFSIVMIAAVIIGLIVWYFKYKPLRDHALANIADLEG